MSTELTATRTAGRRSAEPRTGVFAVDMVAGLLQHYKRFNRPVQDVTLAPRLWRQFEKYMADKFPEHADAMRETGAVQFHDVEVRRGSRLQIANVYWTLKTLIIDPHYKPEDFGHETGL